MFRFGASERSRLLGASCGLFGPLGASWSLLEPLGASWVGNSTTSLLPTFSVSWRLKRRSCRRFQSPDAFLGLPAASWRPSETSWSPPRPPGRTWRSPAASWRPPGGLLAASWRPPGGLLDASWSFLATSWRLLGLPNRLKDTQDAQKGCPRRPKKRRVKLSPLTKHGDSNRKHTCHLPFEDDSDDRNSDRNLNRNGDRNGDQTCCHLCLCCVASLLPAIFVSTHVYAYRVNASIYIYII